MSTIEALQEYDPSVEVIASNLRKLATIIKILSGTNGGGEEAETLAINAFQCAIIMEQIAKAVQLGHEDELEPLMTRLKLHSNVP